MMRYITRIGYACLFIFSSFFTFSQAPTFKIYPEQVSGNQGDTVEFKVVARSYNKVVGFQFSIEWDSTFLKLVSTTKEINEKAFFLSQNVAFKPFLTIQKNSLITVFIDNNIEGNSILPSEDSTLLIIKFLGIQGFDKQSICFGGIVNSELIYMDSNDNCITANHPKTLCNTINFNELGICNYNLEGVMFDSPKLPVTLKASPIRGVKPYSYDWGNNIITDSLVVTKPINGQHFNVVIKDASNDSFRVKYILLST